MAELDERAHSARVGAEGAWVVYAAEVALLAFFIALMTALCFGMSYCQPPGCLHGVLAAYLSAHMTVLNSRALCAAWRSRSVTGQCQRRLNFDPLTTRDDTGHFQPPTTWPGALTAANRSECRLGMPLGT